MGVPIWFDLGSLIFPGEGLFSRKQTLKRASRGSENGTEATFGRSVLTRPARTSDGPQEHHPESAKPLLSRWCEGSNGQLR